MSRLTYQKKSVFVGLVLVLFLGAFLAVTFHTALEGHDAAECPLCLWYQIQGCIITGYLLLLYLTSKPLAISFLPRFFSVFDLPAVGRSPPLF